MSKLIEATMTFRLICAGITDVTKGEGKIYNVSGIVILSFKEWLKNLYLN